MPANLPPYLLAFGAGAFYALSALLCKRGLELGAGTIRSLIFSKLIMALFFIPFPFIEGDVPTLKDIQTGILLGSIFFISQATCFFALEKGDASMITPIMGSKSIFVASFVFFFDLTGTPSTETWIATALAAIAVCLIAWPKNGIKPSYLAISLGLLTAAGFGLTDALVPELAQKSSPAHVIFSMFWTVGLSSFILLPFVQGKFTRFNKSSDKWMFLSCIPMGLQAVLMSVAIGFHEVPAEANVFYACRGIWAIILTAWLGEKIGLFESQIGKAVLSRRLLGASLLIIGIYFTPG